MDSVVTREEAAARWRRDLEGAEAANRRSWPRDVTARMSEFERLTLLTEILMPMRNELKLEVEDTQQRDQPAGRPAGDGYGDGGGTGDEEDTEDLGVNQVYSVILAAAATCNRWLKEDLGPGLRTGGQDFETPMTLDPPTDIDRWTLERAKLPTERPADDDDIEGWLHRAELRMAGTLPDETAPQGEWSEAVGHDIALVREAIHRLTLARLHMRAGDAALITENVYRVVVWLASTLQAWGLALVRTHDAVPEPHDGP